MGDWLGWVIAGIILMIVGYVLQKHVAEAIIKTVGTILFWIGVALFIIGIIFLAVSFI